MYQSKTEQIMRFESTAELGQYCLRHSIYLPSAALSWTGGITGEQAAQLAITGDMRQVAMAQRMMDKFTKEIDTPIMLDVPSVAGCYPCVPDALMGEPESMREPECDANSSAPLSILVDITSSADLKPSQIQRRGTAILAFVMAMSAIRPVSLEVMVALGSTFANAQQDCFSIITAKINTAPLDLATAAYALCHVGFARHLMYGIGFQSFAFEGKWSRFQGVTEGPESNAYLAKIKHYLQLDGDVLLVPPAAERYTALLHAPDQWLQQQLRRFEQRHEAQHYA